jgi:hypothetical protein
MSRSRVLQLLLLLVIVVGVYRWLGIYGARFAGLIVFILYEMFVPP